MPWAAWPPAGWRDSSRQGTCGCSAGPAGPLHKLAACLPCWERPQDHVSAYPGIDASVFASMLDGVWPANPASACMHGKHFMLQNCKTAYTA